MDVLELASGRSLRTRSRLPQRDQRLAAGKPSVPKKGKPSERGNDIDVGRACLELARSARGRAGLGRRCPQRRDGGLARWPVREPRRGARGEDGLATRGHFGRRVQRRRRLRSRMDHRATCLDGDPLGNPRHLRCWPLSRTSSQRAACGRARTHRLRVDGAPRVRRSDTTERSIEGDQTTRLASHALLERRCRAL